jgi:hypothetical protein
MECSTAGNDHIQEMGQYQAGNRPMWHSGFCASALFQTPLDHVVILGPLAGHFGCNRDLSSIINPFLWFNDDRGRISTSWF